MSESDVSTILRALGKVEGKMDGFEAAQDEHGRLVKDTHDYAYRIDSKLNGAMTDIHQRIDKEEHTRSELETKVGTIEKDFLGSFQAHSDQDAESFGMLKLSVQRLTRYAVIVLVVELSVAMALVPEYGPQLLKALASLL